MNILKDHKLRRAAGLLSILAAFVVCSGAESSKPRKTTKKKKPAAQATQPPAVEVRGGPSSDLPTRFLGLWSDGATGEWYAALPTAYSAAEEAVSQLSDETVEKGKFAQTGRSAVALVQAHRLGGWLEVWAEPARIDLERRLLPLQKRHDSVVSQMRVAHAAKIKANEPRFLERCGKQKKTLASIERLRESGQHYEALARAETLYYELLPEGIWYPNLPNSPQPMVPFEKLLDVCWRDCAHEEGGKLLEALAKLRVAENPGFGDVLAAAQSAVEAIRAGKPFRVGSDSLDGPRAAEHLLDRWAQAHVRAVHSRALDWIESELGGKTSRERENESSAAYRNFQLAMGKALAELIDADAEHVSPDELPASYEAFVAALAPSLSRVQPATFVEPIEQALGRMANKSPTLAADVAAYRTATSPMLHCREQRSAAQAGAAAAATSARPVELDRNIETMNGPLPTALPQLSAAWVGKSALAAGGCGGTNRQIMVTGAEGNISYGFACHDRLRDAAAALADALLVDDSHGPLTLEAAIALAQARRGDVVVAGGTVDRLELVGLMPDWLHADERIAGIPRLGLLPSTRVTEALGTVVRMHVELKPQWYRQQHAFVPIESKP